MTRVVHPTGPTNSPLLALIGEAPGREEEQRGQPFVGRSGELLDRMLSSVGIARQDCYISNVANTRPPNNDFGAVYYSDKGRRKPREVLLDCRERLSRELSEVKPKVIVALGEEALRGICLKYGITNRRGMMIESLIYGHEVRIMPTFHPSYILRAYGDRPIVELDLAKAIRQARCPYLPKIDFNIRPSFDETMEWLSVQHTPVSLDIETTPGFKIKRIGFGWSDSQAISIPLIWGGTHAWSLEQETMILQCLNTYLANPEIKKYVQNAPYDCTVLANELGIHVDGISLDTMYAQHLLYPELPKSLDFLTSIYTDFPMYWALKNAGDEENSKYNCYDLVVTFIAAQKITDELIERDLMEFYLNRTHPTMLALTRMQNRGIRMDTEAREIIRGESESKLKTSLDVLNKVAGREVNPNSPKQVKELIYGDWKLPIQKSLSTKKTTTDDDALRALTRKFPHHGGGLKAILNCRQARKLISTYIDARLDEGYVRTSYGLTKTGRITSSKTIEGFGGNLQNIPRGEFRRLYIPDPGKVLIKADLSQAEYMVFCWEAPVPEFIHAYTTDPTFDVHLLNASRIFEIPMEAVTKERRYVTKQGVYAGNYRIGALKLSKMHDMAFSQAQKIIEGYKKSCPELEIWWAKVEDRIRTTRTLRNVFGRERIFFGRIDNALFRAAYDWICQSTVADIINQALVELDKLEVEVLLQVHDELVFQCEDDPIVIKDTVRKIKNAMEISLTFPGVDVPLVVPVEIAVGKNWFDVVEYKE